MYMFYMLSPKYSGSLTLTAGIGIRDLSYQPQQQFFLYIDMKLQCERDKLPTKCLSGVQTLGPTRGLEPRASGLPCEHSAI